MKLASQNTYCFEDLEKQISHFDLLIKERIVPTLEIMSKKAYKSNALNSYHLNQRSLITTSLENSSQQQSFLSSGPLRIEDLESMSESQSSITILEDTLDDLKAKILSEKESDCIENCLQDYTQSSVFMGNFWSKMT